MMTQNGLLVKKNNGLVVYADDQYINRVSLSMNLQDIGMADRLVKLSNGQEVIDYFKRMFDELEQNEPTSLTTIQPVTLLLLDINMPILTGIQTYVLVKKMYKEFNTKFIDKAT